MEQQRKIYPLKQYGNIIAVVFYFFTMFLGCGILALIVMGIYCGVNPSIPTDEVMNILKAQKGDYSELAIHAAAMINSIGNFLTYLILFIVILICMYSFFKEDALKLKQNYKKNLMLIPLFAAIFYGLSILVSLIIGFFVKDVSINQNDIESMILKGSPTLTFIAVVLLAPIVEEVIYRKAIFNLCEKKPIWISYLVSGICFMLPHMISSIGEFNFGNWLLMCIPYLCSGLMLCGIYHYTGKNVYASWFAHLVNNLVAFILIIAG